MTQYKTNKRYAEVLEFVEEEYTCHDTTVVVRGENGVTFTWETSKKSKSYKTLKEQRKGKFSFTYKDSENYERVISHLRPIDIVK